MCRWLGLLLEQAFHILICDVIADSMLYDNCNANRQCYLEDVRNPTNDKFWFPLKFTKYRLQGWVWGSDLQLFHGF